MRSTLSKALLQLGHFLMRFVRRFSRHSLQKTWPHVFKTAFLKLLRQTEQTTRFCAELVTSFERIGSI